MTDPAHWDEVYRRKGASAVSWFRPRLETSLELLAEAGIGPGSAVIDVGAGASTLVDDLLRLGVAHVTLLDLAGEGLRIAQERVGHDERVAWLVGDVATAALPKGAYDAWHDRAVLHFLGDPRDVSAYACQAAHAVRPGGHAAIGGFAPDGPERCSGLPVTRRDARAIAEALGDAFELVREHHEFHCTPGGSSQSFAWALLRRVR